MVFRRLDAARLKLHGHLNKYVLSWLTDDHVPSGIPLTIMIPLAPKDVIRVRRTIQMLRLYVAHPIDDIVIAAPDTPEIRAMCAAEGVTFLDERAPLLPILGAERLDALEGWYRQQFLKLMAPGAVGARWVLAMDADTYPIRPTTFLTQDGRTIFYMTTRDRNPFATFTRDMIGAARVRMSSFVSHCMLFEADHLAKLHSSIEDHCRQPWIDALLHQIGRPMNEAGLMSEFDLYGQHLLRSNPLGMTTRPSSNLKVSIGQFLGDRELPWWNRRFRFLSSHQHLI